MYKTKVWIHKNVEELSKNEAPFSIDYTFIDPPKEGEIIKITNEMAKDIADKPLWKNEYGPGNYIIQTSANMFKPKINDGFSYSVMALKVE